MKNLIIELEREQMKNCFPLFFPGDTIKVYSFIAEENKKRLQVFEGVVIGIRKRGLNTSFIVRKLLGSFGGVERLFKLYSPNLKEILIKKRGLVRKSKLYYLRKYFGKSAKIKEKIIKVR